MDLKKIILNAFTIFNTFYLSGVIYIEFYIPKTDYISAEGFYDLWFYVFFGYIAIFIINYAMFGKVTLWNFKDKNKII
jgi:hypothetical protein